LSQKTKKEKISDTEKDEKEFIYSKRNKGKEMGSYLLLTNGTGKLN